MPKKKDNLPPLYREDEEVLSKSGSDKQLGERVFDYKIKSELTREIEIRGLSFTANFYITTANTRGIRVPLKDNAPLFDRFYEYCKEIEKERIEKEIDANLIAFTTFGKLDKGLEFFPVYGFYVYPYGAKGKDPYIIFNQEKNAPSPLERLEAFVDYYRKKFGIRVRPKKSSFDSLRELDLTEI
jgi:hypothetical protein